MKVNMPMAVTAADTIKRTITGTIVTWNEQGNTSVGPTVFAADSIEIKPVKLLLEHDRTRPIGKMVSHNITANGIEATFKIANTMAGEDALANRSNERLHGVISFHEDAIPIWAFLKSSSCIPTARSIPRAGALSKPSVTKPDLGFILLGGFFSLMRLVYCPKCFNNNSLTLAASA